MTQVSWSILGNVDNTLNTLAEYYPKSSLAYWAAVCRSIPRVLR